MSATNITVIKASGERQPFSERKVRHSIRRARIPIKLENQVLEHIYEILYDGIPTSEIYQHISEFLGNSPHPHTRALYSLKQAIMQLGPSGFPFEKFIARILDHQGYDTQTNAVISGKCVDHEMDVVAQKENKHYMIECKFHNRPGTRSDVKVALYIQARFEDIASQWKLQPGHLQKFHQPWLVTNTKCTTEAIRYANCVGMRLTSWGHPARGNLQDLIEEANLHPITCLTSLTQEQKKLLLQQDVVLCKDLLERKPEFIDKLELGGQAEKDLIKELTAVCGQSQPQKVLHKDLP